MSASAARPVASSSRSASASTDREPGVGQPGPRHAAFHIQHKEMTMEREENDPVELGTVSADTAGDWGPPFEPAGRMIRPAISQD